MATYLNDLRLKEIATGDESGTWGTSTNINLSLIADAFSLGTKQMAADADETFTMPDATADGTRSLYLKITSAGSLTTTRTVTLAPNTVSKVWIIENATTGSQSITIAQGSGSSVTVATGTRAIVVTDGAGAGAAVTLVNPTTAQVASTVTFANRTTNESGHAVFISTTATGNEAMYTNTNYRFNPSTAELSATNFNSTSDATMKHNIQTIQGALSTVQNLRGVRFTWNSTGFPGIGVVAQEVERHVPEVVVTAEDGGKSVQYGNLVGVLIEAIKDQQRQIDDLWRQLGNKA